MVWCNEMVMLVWRIYCRYVEVLCFFFFFSSRRRHTRFDCDWSSDVCSSDLFSEYTLYPTIQLQIFPELLPQSKASIVFVVMSGTLQSVTMNYANFEFLPTKIGRAHV